MGGTIWVCQIAYLRSDVVILLSLGLLAGKSAVGLKGEHIGIRIRRQVNPFQQRLVPPVLVLEAHHVLSEHRLVPGHDAIDIWGRALE